MIPTNNPLASKGDGSGFASPHFAGPVRNPTKEGSYKIATQRGPPQTGEAETFLHTFPTMVPHHILNPTQHNRGAGGRRQASVGVSPCILLPQYRLSLSCFLLFGQSYLAVTRAQTKKNWTQCSLNLGPWRMVSNRLTSATSWVSPPSPPQQQNEYRRWGGYVQGARASTWPWACPLPPKIPKEQLGLGGG